jgi:putative toxin-antitoxin system antitoxin component (TIGR02293 family)
MAPEATARRRITGLLGQDATTAVALIPMVRAGLRYRAVRSVATYVDASLDEVATSLGVAKRTLNRRRVEGRLDARTSEKIVRLARVAVRAEEVLGGVDEMRRWLRTPNRALGRVAPVTILDTDVGAEAVLDVLGRIEHGVFS